MKQQKKKEEDSEEVHVYPLRKKRVTKLMSLIIPDDDDFLCEFVFIENYFICSSKFLYVFYTSWGACNFLLNKKNTVRSIIDT